MVDEGVKHVPVVVGTTLVGICTRTDLLDGPATATRSRTTRRGWHRSTAAAHERHTVIMSDGDPACWLDRVCEQCGGLIEGPEHECRISVERSSSEGADEHGSAEPG